MNRREEAAREFLVRVANADPMDGAELNAAAHGGYLGFRRDYGENE
jgi:hypothetical protein